MLLSQHISVMDFETILEETKRDYKPEKHCRGLNISDPYFSTMKEHYNKINKYVLTTLDGKKGAERGGLLGYMNQKIQTIINDDDLIMFILENLPYKVNNIDDF